jgi:hypothetical protein
MRPLAIAATVLTCAAATAAGAQTSSRASVYPYNAPAVTKSPAVAPQALLSQLRGFQGHDDQISALALLNDAAFAPKTASSDVDPISRLIEREGYQPGAGIVRWMTGTTQLAPSGGRAVDSLRVSVGGELGGLRGLPLNLANAQYNADAYEVALTRDWPAALAFDAKGFGVDLTPHAGVGVTNLGGSAEAGATLRLTQRDASVTERLNAMGVKDGGSTFGDRGRWYLFAAASGRAVGLNMLHGDQGWDRAGWTTDQTSTLIGDAQLGVGFRKGPMQTSLGYIHREVKGAHQLWGVENHDDSLVAFSLQIRPGK